LEIYDKNWTKIFTHKGNPESYGGIISFSPDEKFLALARYKGKGDIAIINLEERKVIQVLNGHAYYIQDIEFSKSGNYLASCSIDNDVKIWKKQGISFFFHQECKEHEKKVSGLSFSFDDKYLVSASDDKHLLVREFKNGIYQVKHSVLASKGYIKDVCFHPGKYELASDSPEGINIWQIQKHGLSKIDSIHNKSRPNALINYSPTGDYLCLGYGSHLKLYNKPANKYSYSESIYRHDGKVYGGCFSFDGKFLVSFGADKRVLIWEVEGVKPSALSLLASYLGGKFTAAQLKAIDARRINEILSSLPKELTSQP